MTRKEKITLDITLNEQNICEKIEWDATQKPVEGIENAKAMALALWENWDKGTAKIDLWTKDMEVHEMKRFCIETISGMADTIRKATGDEVMAMDMENLCERLHERLKAELNNA
ncbi:MAG: gliding motility protein GldC [Bacteroidota bacterium]